MNFSEYAAYYDLIYQQKNYEHEVNFLIKLIKKYDLLGSSLVCDIGSGTGKHAELFHEIGYKVTGIELSPKMIAVAKTRCGEKVQFVNASIQDFQSAQDFDVCISLFHVISYLTSDTDLELAFKNVSVNLRNGGLFLFDFWFYDGVHHLKPEDRVHDFLGTDLNVKKIVKSNWRNKENLVIINYLMEVKFRDTPVQFIRETHKMRYFKLEEINALAENAGFEVLEFTHFYDGSDVNPNCWAIGCVARKI